MSVPDEITWIANQSRDHAPTRAQHTSDKGKQEQKWLFGRGNFNKNKVVEAYAIFFFFFF